jgi:hypothetical protein
LVAVAERIDPNDVRARGVRCLACLHPQMGHDHSRCWPIRVPKYSPSNDACPRDTVAHLVCVRVDRVRVEVAVTLRKVGVVTHAFAVRPTVVRLLGTNVPKEKVNVEQWSEFEFESI